MLLKIGIGFLAISSALLSAAGLAVYQAGIAIVKVQDADVNLFIPVPLAAADVALVFLPQEQKQEISQQIAPHKELIRAALQELGDCPDVLLVEVVDHDETVMVSKDGENLIVDVNNPDEKVYVKVPVYGVTRLVNRLMD